MTPPRGDTQMPRHRRAAPTSSRRSTTRQHPSFIVIALIAFTVTATVVAAGILVGLKLTIRSSSRSASHPPASTASVTPSTSAVAAPAPSPSLRAESLETDFIQLRSTMDGPVGIALGPVGTTKEPILLGDWLSGPAWSTMKVPLAIAVLRAEDPPTVTDSMTAAITQSDNAAADVLWQSLGDPQTAASKVGDVLRATGDPTTVQSQRVRPQFSAFGQTDWALTDQVHFLAAAACDDHNKPVFDLMGQIASDQQWGLSEMSDARFKGGWGPSESGAYLVRQIGVIMTGAGEVAVAVAVQPSSGSFGEGTAELTRIAGWLGEHASALPAGRCAP
jgi:hypothetical protein